MESAIVKSIENIITFKFFLNIGRPEDILNVLTASRWGIMIVWEKTFNRVVKGWFIIFDNYPISMINTMNWLQTTFFSFCHKWFSPQFSNLHIRLIKLAKNHFSYQLKITYYLLNTCCFVHKIDFSSSIWYTKTSFKKVSFL